MVSSQFGFLVVGKPWAGVDYGMLHDRSGGRGPWEGVWVSLKNTFVSLKSTPVSLSNTLEPLYTG